MEFELSKVAEMPYNMDFVEKIKQADEDLLYWINTGNKPVLKKLQSQQDELLKIHT